MKKLLTAGIVLLSIGLMAPGSHAMRCGTDLITENSTKFEVLQACGEPQEKIGETLTIDKEGIGTDGAEKWIYDIGGGVYHIVTFQDDEVWDIKTELK